MAAIYNIKIDKNYFDEAIKIMEEENKDLLAELEKLLTKKTL